MALIMIAATSYCLEKQVVTLPVSMLIGRFRQYKLQKPDAVTAFISDRFAYVAHGRIVSKFRISQPVELLKKR